MTPQVQLGASDALAKVAGALLKLQPHGATPPVNAYVPGGGSLRLRIWTRTTNITPSMAALVLLPDGTIAKNLWQPTSFVARTINQFFFPLPEGFLLTVTFFGFPVNAPNSIWAQIDLETATALQGLDSQVLCQGYCNQQSRLCWPNGELANATDGYGAPLDITGTTPGAGAEISETVPAGALWRLKAFTFRLTASAAVANRIPHLIIDDGANVLIDSPITTALTAGQTGRIVTGDDAFNVAAIDGTQWVQMVDGLRLLPGYRIRTLTTGLQAGDQYTAPQYYVDEYLVA